MRKRRCYASNFWDHVDKSNGPDACWPWLHYTSQGYGIIYIDGRPRGAHRVAYKLAHGTIDGRIVRHSCDNPPCCNPSHLTAGSHKDNTRDMMAKGRAKFWGNKVRLGSAHHKAKLTENDIPTIRKLISESVPLTEIAKRFNVGPPNIGWIKRGLTWRHVK